MEFLFEILRRKHSEDEPYLQQLIFNTDDIGATVATALRTINETAVFKDISGNVIEPIKWEQSCLQKKCGACAMVINGRPRLACDTFLKDYIKRKKIRLEPFKKFPVVADLIVDRSVMFENLKLLKLAAKENIRLNDKQTETAYEASRCIQCGCCLEVCPNFEPNGDFVGAAAFVPATRLLTVLSEKEAEEIKKEYNKRVYKGCAKSLACMDICPAGINIDNLLSKSNAVSAWRRKK